MAGEALDQQGRGCLRRALFRGLLPEHHCNQVGKRGARQEVKPQHSRAGFS